MKLANVCNEDLKKVALLKTKKGIATSDAKHAQQILLSRSKLRMFSGSSSYHPTFSTNLDTNPERNYKSFAEENNGLSLEEYLEYEKQRMKEKYSKRKE